MGHYPFSKLREKMTPEQRARVDMMTKLMMAEMLFTELSKLGEVSREDLAAAIGIGMWEASELGDQDDMQITAVQGLVESLGGQLEIVLHLPRGDIRIGQFKEAS